ncbi:MAG: hypothetical protein J6B50_03690, partial [Lachnospiraceae bacterium]|nr:hypothetical protein [Lachnospiraceae bacterium]
PFDNYILSLPKDVFEVSIFRNGYFLKWGYKKKNTNIDKGYNKCCRVFLQCRRCVTISIVATSREKCAITKESIPENIFELSKLKSI